MQLKGRVVDADGAEVIGATIVIKGTTTGTVTDADGYFEFIVSELRSYTIEVRYAGMLSQEVTAEPGVPFRIVMETDPYDPGEFIIGGAG